MGEIREHLRQAEGDDMANHHQMLSAAIKRGDGLQHWGKKMAALASQFQSLYAHALVEMERFRDQAKVTDRLRQEHWDLYHANEADPDMMELQTDSPWRAGETPSTDSAHEEKV